MGARRVTTLADVIGPERVAQMVEENRQREAKIAQLRHEARNPGPKLRAELAALKAEVAQLPEVEAGDRVLVVNGTLGSDGLIGTVMAKSVQVTGDPVIGISGGGTKHTVFAWLRVGGVEQGPRPEEGRDVIVLNVPRPTNWDIGWVGYAARVDPDGPIYVGDPEDDEGRNGLCCVTEWAIIPEVDGMGEATATTTDDGHPLARETAVAQLNSLVKYLDGWGYEAQAQDVAVLAKRMDTGGRTVGSLNADDIGRDVTALGMTLTVEEITLYRDEDGEPMVNLAGRRGKFDDDQSFPPGTPCKVSEGPGETT